MTPQTNQTNERHDPQVQTERSRAVDAHALAARIKRTTSAEVRFSPGSRALYATDSSNFRQVPIGVVVPRSVEDIVGTVAACREHNAPVLVRGGGTSLAGQCCNVAVVIDTSKYLNKIIELDPHTRRARVEPGLVLDDLRLAAEQHHLTFGPDPSTHNHCTLGGMIGNNSCGVHSVMAGKTVDNIEELEVLTYDGVRMRVGATSEEQLAKIVAEGGRRGEIYAALRGIRDTYTDLIRERFPRIPRRVSGYNLDELLPENGFNVARALVGTESTCVLVLGATTRLVHSPPARALLVLGYRDIYAAGDHVPQVLEHHPIGLEALDDFMIANMATKNLVPEGRKLLPAGKGWLLAEFGADTKDEADDIARQVKAALERERDAPTVVMYDTPEQEELIWKVREAGLGATADLPGEQETWEGWEDSAVPPDKVGDYLRDLHKLYDRYGYKGALYGHFGDGCIHTRVNFDLRTHTGIATYRAFLHDAADLVIGYGGSLSGEHGDGQSRGELLPKMFGPELMGAFEQFKRAWDPDLMMNPGKVIAPDRATPYREDENLRLGADYQPAHVTTHFSFPADAGSFAQATLRCVGVGECRKHDGGSMCPSYMATRDEEHSTRGRARLLFEMMEGQELTGTWRNDDVRNALDLCLACKGCKAECPTGVDMATYKAEFLSHYYERRLRPRVAYSMGLIYWWANLARRAPRLVNFMSHARALSPMAHWIAGVSPERTIPSFASQTFTDWFRCRPPRQDSPTKGPVMLWPDTFNNNFHPEVAQAAVEVLERAGYEVTIPRRRLCCGRPLFDWGMLPRAKRLLLEVLDTLRDDIRAGVPMVGLEPSCVAVFRDELTNLLPDDQDAHRLRAQTFLLSEFLVNNDYVPAKLHRKAVVHGHCHHKSILGMEAEERLLGQIGVDLNVLDSGCCGMAGAFGFERDKYALSVQIGERVLLPAVREAQRDSIIVTNGFSCREQINQTTNRRALHLAQVLKLALDSGPDGPDRNLNPEAVFYKHTSHEGGSGVHQPSMRQQKPSHMHHTGN